MRFFSELLVSIIILRISFVALAQSPAYDLGRTPTQEEISEWPMPVSPTGVGLRPGRGTAREGATIYAQSCIFCHGPNGMNGPFNTLKGSVPLAPYATTIWDYIYRAMPRKLENPGAQERQLSADEVYALTAYILNLNGLIGENEVLDADSLPKVKIPIQLLER